MEVAFWDSSSLVPLCVEQPSTSIVEALQVRYDMAVWWSAPVEVKGAFARLMRMKQLTGPGQVQAIIVLERLRTAWIEIEPTEQLREQAERLVERFPLKAADAQQLAAAMTWCQGRTRGRAFISGDGQLLVAARDLGFAAIVA